MTTAPRLATTETAPRINWESVDTPDGLNGLILGLLPFLPAGFRELGESERRELIRQALGMLLHD